MGLKTSDSCTLSASGPRIEWSEVRDRVSLEMVATNLLGPAAKRQGPRLLWPCPLHDDHDPSFQVDLTRKTWRCWVCAIGGDASELVRRINNCDFPTAVKFLADLAGVIPPSGGPSVRPAPVPVARKPASPPVVSLPGRDTKNSNDAVQPLPSHVIPALRSWLASKPSMSPLFPRIAIRPS